MSEFNFSVGCGANTSFIKICIKGNLCSNCVEAWACQVKYEKLLKENTAMKAQHIEDTNILNQEIDKWRAKVERLEAKNKHYREYIIDMEKKG